AGYVIASALGGLIVAQSSFAAIFVVSAGIGFAVLAFSLLLHEPPEPAELDDDDDFNLREFLAPFSDTRLLPWYAVIVVNMFFVGILFGFVPVYLNSIRYDPFTAGLIVSAGRLAYLVVQPPAGWFADHIGG